MKYEIPQDKLDKLIFKYLDLNLKGLEKRKAKYYGGIVFVNPDQQYGVLGWKYTGILYVYPELIEEISDNFGLEKYDSKELIGRWVSDRLQLEFKNTLPLHKSYFSPTNDRLQLEVKNTQKVVVPDAVMLVIDYN